MYEIYLHGFVPSTSGTATPTSTLYTHHRAVGRGSNLTVSTIHPPASEPTTSSTTPQP